METEKVYQEKTARTIQQKQDGSGTYFTLLDT